ncbi:MAG: hypothetical protein ACRD7E_27830 [Bryobacteraceae bacterium]
MPENEDQIQSAIEDLLASDEAQLFEELAIRNRAMVKDPSVAGSYKPRVSYNAALMGPMDDLRNFGRRLFNKVNKDCYQLVCGGGDADKQEREKLLDAFKLGKTEVAAAMAALFVAYLNVAPAIAAVLAALVVKLFFKNAHEAMCEVWSEKLETKSGGD